MPHIDNLFSHDLNGVIELISPDDEMFQGNMDHYLGVGKSALSCIKLAILSAGKNLSEIKQILDLPCGYGRVLRMIKVAFPQANITACDLLYEGVSFCEQVFKATPLFSDKDIKKVVPHNKFDLIWCGSLLTHLDFNLWHDFFQFFYNVLQSGGILVFTTHGRFVAELIRSNKNKYGLTEPALLKKMINDFDENGFGFGNYHHSNDYGISISAPYWVMKLLHNMPGLSVMIFRERGWDNHQDIVGCIKQV